MLNFTIQSVCLVFDFVLKSTIDCDTLWNDIIKGTDPKSEKSKESHADKSSIESQTNESSSESHVAPTMVFSVIGDSDSFVSRPWPTTLFQTALIEAAKSGGGTNLLHTIV